MPMPRARSKYTVLCDGEEDEVLELLMRGEEHEVRKMVVAFFDTYLLSYKKLNALSGIGGVTWNIYRNNKPLSQSALYRIHSLYCNLKNHPEKTNAFLWANRKASDLLEENFRSNGTLVMGESYSRQAQLTIEYWAYAQKLPGFTQVLEKHFEYMKAPLFPRLRAELLKDVVAYFEQQQVRQFFPIWFLNSVKERKFHRLIRAWYRDKRTERGINPFGGGDANAHIPAHKQISVTPHGAHSSQEY